jgi:hypothetical protein
MIRMQKEVLPTLSVKRGILLVLLGVALGVGLTVGSYYGVREYAPHLATWYLGRFAEASQPVQIDTAQVQALVSDILASEQGRAVVSDLMQGQSREAFEELMKEAMKSPEFRQMLSDVLGTFLTSPEGKELLKRVAKEALMP